MTIKDLAGLVACLAIIQVICTAGFSYLTIKAIVDRAEQNRGKS